MTKTHTVGVTSEAIFLVGDVAANSTVGFVTDIYVSSIPEIISIGSTIGIGTERLSVLRIYPESKVIRVTRGLSGAGHTSTTQITEVSNTISVPIKTNQFSSNLNEEYYFNATQQLGIGATAGIGVSYVYAVGDNAGPISIPTQSIYLPNHPFNNNQQVVLAAPVGASKISVSNAEASPTFQYSRRHNTKSVHSQ